MKRITKTSLLVALICLSITLYYALTLTSPLGLNDEGLMLYGALRVSDGHIPYRDMWMTGYPPGQFYVLAGLFKLFGPSVLVARLYGITVLLALSILWFLLARKVLPSNIALLVWLATGIVLVPSGSIMLVYPVFPALALGTLGILLLLTAVQPNGKINGKSDRISKSLLFPGGLCMGLAILFRHDLGIYASVAGTSCLLLAAISSSLTIMRATKTFILPYILGATSVLLPSVMFLLITAPPALVWEDLFVTPRTVFLKSRHLASPPLLPSGLKLSELDDWVGFYLPLYTFIIGAAFALMLLVRRIRDRIQHNREQQEVQVKRAGQVEQAIPPEQFRTGRREAMVFALVPLIGLNFLQALSRADIIHMIPSYIPAMLLVTMAVTSFLRVEKGLITGLVRASLLVCTLAPLSISSVVMLMRAAPSWIINACPQTGADGRLSQRAFPICLDTGQEKAAEYIVQRTQENEQIFVGLPRHDKIFVNDNSFYFLTGRHSPTRYSILVPGVATTQSVQHEIINALDAARVRYIVLWYGYDEDYTEIRQQDSGSNLLDAYISEHYQRTETFGQYTIAERRPEKQTSYLTLDDE